MTLTEQVVVHQSSPEIHVVGLVFLLYRGTTASIISSGVGVLNGNDLISFEKKNARRLK